MSAIIYFKEEIMILKKTILPIIMFMVIILMIGCSNKTYTIEIHPKDDNKKTQKRVLMFLDGTANNKDSRTNVSKLFEIVSNQNIDNLHMFYNEGVGTVAFGSATGWGIGTDVKQAYSFLSQYYDKNSSLHLYGFSRGAYTARILAGMIYTVGIYDLKHLSESKRKQIIDELYNSYKGGNIFVSKKKTKKEIQRYSTKVVDKWNDKEIILYPPAKIEIMGLWDTVEALGVTQTIESIKDTFGIEDPQEIENPNGRYFDQICNIENVFHALSLDDNRANVFTPIILTGNHVISQCDDDSLIRRVNQIAHVDEVWFSGAHSDVGGGYKVVSENGKITQDNSLSGVSLNWMISRIKKIDSKLLSHDYHTYENILGFIHDAESYPLINNAIYKNATRTDIINIDYLKSSNYNKIKFHSSVINRLNNLVREDDYKSKWYLTNNCIYKDNKGTYRIRKNSKECEEVNNNN